MPSYRLCTADGVLQLTEGLAARLVEVLEARVGVDDGRKDLFCNPRDNATQVIIVNVRTLQNAIPFHFSTNFFHEGGTKATHHHRERLPRASLSIREDSTVVPIHNVFNRIISLQTLHRFTKGAHIPATILSPRISHITRNSPDTQIKDTHSLTPYSKISTCCVPIGNTRSYVNPSFSGPLASCADLRWAV